MRFLTYRLCGLLAWCLNIGHACWSIATATEILLVGCRWEKDGYRCPPKGFREQGKRVFFQGNRGQVLRGTKTIFWNREHKKTIFDFWGTSQIISGDQGNRYPPGRASLQVLCYMCRGAIISDMSADLASLSDTPACTVQQTWGELLRKVMH